MITFPNAKINLGLQIISRRPDRYHNLATVFYPVGWSDALEIVPASVPAGECRLHVSGIVIEGDAHNNLVVKAYRLLAEDFSLPAVDIYLHKNIPFGAGLGGGSADASFMLRMLRDLFSLPLSDDDLARYAVRLGADCPFFIYNRPMLAEGIGDVLSPIEVSLTGYSLVLVKPSVSVSTAEAYSLVTPSIPVIPLCKILQCPISLWRDVLTNDFERSVFSHYPQLARLKWRLYDAGAVYASMSGSGSTLYALFTDLPADLSSRFPDCQLWSGPCLY